MGKIQELYVGELIVTDEQTRRVSVKSPPPPRYEVYIRKMYIL